MAVRGLFLPKRFTNFSGNYQQLALGTTVFTAGWVFWMKLLPAFIRTYLLTA